MFYSGDKIPCDDGEYFLILNIEGTFITVKRNHGIPFTMSIYNFIKKHRTEFVDKKIAKRDFREKRLSELIEIEENKPEPVIQKKVFCSYWEAKKWVTENLVPLGIVSSNTWYDYLHGDYPNAPALPELVPRTLLKEYRYSGWKSWREFFNGEIVDVNAIDEKEKNQKEKTEYYCRYARRHGHREAEVYELIHF